MVVVDLDAKVVEGTLRPSSDTKTHAALYRAFQGIGGIVHTHSTYATAWAQARMPIPIYGTTHADHLAEDVPCTAIMTAEAVAGTTKPRPGTQIIDCFRTRDPRQTPMVLVAGHAPFTWGKTADKAVYHAVVLEELAKMAFITRSLDPQADHCPSTWCASTSSASTGRAPTMGNDVALRANQVLATVAPERTGPTMRRALQVVGSIRSADDRLRVDRAFAQKTEATQSTRRNTDEPKVAEPPAPALARPATSDARAAPASPNRRSATPR